MKQPPELSSKKGVLKNVAEFYWKSLSQSLKPVTLFKERLWHRCFPVNFVKFLRTPFWHNTSEWLFLKVSASQEDSIIQQNPSTKHIKEFSRIMNYYFCENFKTTVSTYLLFQDKRRKVAKLSDVSNLDK